MTDDRADRILIIKLGALGDFIQALGPMKAIRDHHPDDDIVLMTTLPFVDLAHATGWFDSVWADTRPKIWQIGQVRALGRRLNQTRFKRVYDLQTSDRSSFYFRLFSSPKPEWSGIAKGCSHSHDDPRRDIIHTLDRQADQLRIAGIEEVPPPDLSWVEVDLGRFDLPETFALLLPCGSAHRPGKRWPAEHYGEVARRLRARGLHPVVMGTAVEAEADRIIRQACPEAISLIAQTSILEMAAVARRATVALGNDSGPMHVVAVTGCPSLVLYSYESDPVLCGQRGKRVEILREREISEVSVDAVWTQLESLS